MNREALIEEILAGEHLREPVVGRLKARKCSLCPDGIAPPGQAHCRPCTRLLNAEKKARRERAQAGNWKYRLFKVAYWRGCAVGFYNQAGTDKLAVRPLFKELAELPKCKLVNLDTYCEGYDRDQVAIMKRSIRRYFPNIPPAVK